MSKKPKGRKRAQLATEQEAKPVASEPVISKTQKRKMQKKRQKLSAKHEREQAAASRQEAKEAKEAARTARALEIAAAAHPPPPPLTFAADEDDHCETAPEAYRDVAPLLHLLAAHLGKTPAELRVYDPYFCNGAVARHLAALGFTSVHNVNEDFYEVDASGRVPAHDVLLTNPPYSADHPARLLRFIARNGTPWLALMPNWVAARDYYADGDSGGRFYIVPKKRYSPVSTDSNARPHHSRSARDEQALTTVVVRP